MRFKWGYRMERLISLVGIFAILGVAYLLSDNRKKISRKLVIWGVGLQGIFALLVLGVPVLGWEGPLYPLFDFANIAFKALMDYTLKGTGFIFGSLADPGKPAGWIFGIMVLPTIIFFSSLYGNCLPLKNHPTGGAMDGDDYAIHDGNQWG